MAEVRQSAESVVKEFVDLVRQSMDEQGWNPSSLSEATGCGRSYLYRVLNGSQVPSFEWAEKVASILGITISVKCSRRKARA